jgi:WD40 repeat protein
VGEQDVSLWEIANETKTVAHTLSGHTGQIWATAIAADGLIATGGDDQTLRLWQRDGEPNQTISDFDAGIRGLEFVPKTAAIASITRNGKFQLWDSVDGTVRHNFEQNRSSLEAIAVHPDGELFAVGGGDRQIELWTMADQKPQLLPLHQDAIFNLQFSPDGKYLASGSADSNAVIWNIDAIRQLNAFNYACDWVRDYIAVTPDNPARCTN